MNRIRTSLIASLALLMTGALHATDEPAAPEAPPSWPQSRSFAQLGENKDLLLLGVHNSQQVEFTLPRDRIAQEASLRLDYTPSPALLPGLSHMRIYLNDVLMDTVVIEAEQLGRRTRQQVALAPKLVSDFNQVRIEFVGHYTDVCEDPGHSSLWLSLGRDSTIELREQALTLRNDLAFFPQPFFDKRDRNPLRLHMVLASTPDEQTLQAAAVLASYFGSLAGWRGAEFPVLFDRLPSSMADAKPGHSLVLATNERRPAFMDDMERFPPVAGPEVRLIDHPAASYSKVLLVQGRDEDELALAVRALALGGKLLRGERAEIRDVQSLASRKPYDAPNWTPTDRPVRFAELIDYPGQLQTRGLMPRPIELEVRLPPDLFVWRNQGIPLHTRYRYTAPTANDESRLNISINDEFIAGLPLISGPQNRQETLRLAVSPHETANARDKLMVPSLKIGARNTIRYDFSFATTFGSAQPDRCQTTLAVDNRALIDEESTIDFSGYYHFIAMPDLAAFTRSGFPFSRMADLSETLVLMPATPSAMQIGLMLETLAGIAAQTGYPAINLSLSHDWREARERDADLLVFGDMPEGLEQTTELNALLREPGDWLLQAPARQSAQMRAPARLEQAAFPAEARVEVKAQGPLAAIVGVESPFVSQRSLVALLARDEQDFRLLRQTLSDNGKLGEIQGAVALIRESGVDAQLVGSQYYVGYLPWWLKLWYLLSAHPVLLAVLAALSALLVAVLLWRALRWAAHRRVQEN
ncbi:cellulose biosynthesis cyclic di-GMP-binding regulatory protein BcsB [Zobellella sp. DQSA1]|uniref:cellulose biosynthesis cyclic di-GMP-binding regulatory protein BcsB n=1 Tax=Zobellella sp. DQSA1 TaxID=3342386 RepID=UPI0035C22506